MKLNLEESWMEKPALAELSKGFFERLFEWEPRGRGWKVWDYPVPLEPPFRPLWIDASVSRWSGNVRFSDPPSKEYSKDPDPPVFHVLPKEITEFLISVPTSVEVSKEAAERFILGLSRCRGPVSFDVIGFSEQIAIGMACLNEDRELLVNQLGAYFPEAAVAEVDDLLHKSCSPGGDGKVFLTADFGLKREFFRPLRCPKTFDPDPWLSLVAAFSGIRSGEKGFLQVLFEKTFYPWSETLLERLNAWKGILDDVKEMEPAAEEKFSRPLFAVQLRAGVIADSEERARQIGRSISTAMAQFADPHRAH